ncbi:uncharacterized protein SPAPADRAFT_61205 [Spathaspora passalidarum NRRL Y-27907]|uniref:Rab-GAP TBC domain-containing protein n=1 Tax=Spathaspora passalidarum (strain NRRL Y-27907 / 11-Y1) TaxID=619300 RepID=G3APE3_SPAPN|nr:uncharacterized protein SPAPADRAFT_61205 [Spathaspora passalidarum NRRL Y-27907]EGW32121.1 hypothetical protein SPAPADRAFT_61205 [Spathaspora passalidarum NRRL Y-27907]
MPYDKYTIQVNPLPANLTPSQRLKLRKLNINHTISSQFNSLPRQSVYVDTKDELIDPMDSLFNIPCPRFSTCTASTTSTAASSVFSSSESLSSDDWGEADNMQLELAFKSESARICDEFLEHSKILADFKKVNVSMPALSKPSCSLPRLPPKSPSLPEIPTRPTPPQQTRYQTYTRPTWLPPKSTHDKLKHQHQAGNLINHAISAEAKLQQRRLKTIAKLNKQRQKDIISTWVPYLEAKSTLDTQLKNIDECIWRGVDEEVRAKVWWKSQQLKKSQYNDTFCDYYFHEVGLIHDRIIQSQRLQHEVDMCQRNPNHQKSIQRLSKLNHGLKTELNCSIHNYTLTQWTTIFQTISKKLEHLYPEIHLPIDKVTQVIVAFMLYWHHQTSCDLSTLAAISGLPNLAAILHRTYKGSMYKTLITLCHIFQMKLPNMMLSYLTAAPENQPIIASSISDYIHYEYELTFKDQLDRVYTHFKVRNVEPLAYLPTLVAGLCTNLFSFDLSSHILDIVLLSENNEQFIIQLVLGYMKKIQHKLFGTDQEILHTLLGDNGVNVGYEYEFIDTIKMIK